MYRNRYPHMVHEYYLGLVRERLARRRERLAGLKTEADARRYVQGIRRAIRQSFGPFPERTPLNPVVTGKVDFGKFEVEKVCFKSRPGFLVTGNLFRPKGLSAPAPGVLGLCGHTGLGKAYELYQSFCHGLALRGFVVFIMDPIAQGERDEYTHEDGPIAQNCCRAHNMMGNRLALVDDFFGSWRVWDAIRGLDYLLARPEVDRTRVGVTGNSGGGTLTTYVTALDPRPTMAAPGCFVCSYEANLENELPSDSEQNPPGIIGSGLDQGDLLLAYAPRPTLILAQHDDYFSADYARRTAGEMDRVHRLLGSRGTARVHVGSSGHGFSKENREAMYRFFMQQAGLTGSGTEEPLDLAQPERLWVLPTGSTLAAGSRRVQDFTAEVAAAWARRRGQPSAKAVQAAARRLLGLPAARGVPHHRSLAGAAGFEPDRVPPVNRQFSVETEPGIQAILTTYGPPHGLMHPPTGKITVYIGDVSAENDVERVPEIRALAEGKVPLVVVDPRGLGQSAPQTCGCADIGAPYGSDFLYASTGEMLGQSLLGRRVFDVLRSLDWLKAKGATDIELVGRGLGSVIAAFAGLLHPAGPRVRLLHYLPSYQMLVDARQYAWPLSAILRGVLRHFDLPDVYRALGERLSLEQPWNARREPI
jgi:dienelactone hydrolase/pimeloyl-ACP methyl ester carboxylesterase